MKTAAIALILAALLSGCYTVRPCETAKIQCVQYANAAWRAEHRAGNRCEVVICRLKGSTKLHAVVAVWCDGVERFYDPAFGFYRDDIGMIYGRADRPFRDAYDSWHNAEWVNGGEL